MSMLNSFDGIATLYNSIEPLRGKRKSWDIRPLSKRAKWWNRIIKVDDSTYALSDGQYAANYGRGQHVLYDSLELLLDTAPIIWRRKPDGDYIQVRSDFNYGSTSRYEFLSTYLPYKLRHQYNTSGQHWLCDMNTNERYLLLHGKIRFTDNKVSEYEDKALEFKVLTNGFELVGEPHKKTVPIVNRELTQHYNPKIKELWEYARMILPVFGDTLLDQQRPKADTLKDKYLGGSAWSWFRRIDKSAIRELLDNPETLAEERLAFCVITAIHLDMYESIYEQKNLGNGRTYSAVSGGRFKEDKNSYTRFKNFMHRVGGMKTTKEVDFT